MTPFEAASLKIGDRVTRPTLLGGLMSGEVTAVRDEKTEIRWDDYQPGWWSNYFMVTVTREKEPCPNCEGGGCTSCLPD